MNDVEPSRRGRTRFSLLHLLTFTTLIAVGIAVGLAYRKNRSLSQQIDALRSLSSRLQFTNEDELVSLAMPRVAYDFYTWQVHVPKGQDYELRLGMGAVSENGIPPVVGSTRLAAGQHRVTLHTGDSPSEEFRYLVYVDGVQVIEKSMGRDWIPDGWSSSHSISWPRGPKQSATTLQLAGQSYKPNRDFGPQHYFNGQSDNFVTQQGYRLWIDKPDCTYQPASPFKGLPGDSLYDGVGLRDGIRLCASFRSPYQWTFNRPTLDTAHPLLLMEADFFASDGELLSSQSPSFESWQLRNAAVGVDGLQWQADPTQTRHTAFLHAVSKGDTRLRPVVEIQWDTTKPDEVGLRLADTPANESIVRWRLRIVEGSHHLWRELQVGDRPWLTPKEAMNAGGATDFGLNESSAKPSIRTAKLELEKDATENIRLHWQANETLPLQIVQRSQKSHADLDLYQGLPVKLGIQIPDSMEPTLAVDIVDEHPSVPDAGFPGGPVFDEIRIDLDAVNQDWIWVSAKSKP